MKHKVICFGLAITLFASAAFAETLFVSTDSADILADEGGFNPVIATAKKGTSLTVLERDGKWIKVQAGDQVGYVYLDSLSADKPNGDFTAGLSVNTGMSEGAAGKGLGPEATQYASGKNLSPKAMDALIDFSKTIKAADVKAFAVEGKVGLAKPAKP